MQILDPKKSKGTPQRGCRLHQMEHMFRQFLTCSSILITHENVLSKGIYQVQTNLSVQTVQTSIWTTLNWVITLLQIPHPTSLRPSPWMLIRWPRLKFAQFTRRGWFAHNMFPFLCNYTTTPNLEKYPVESPFLGGTVKHKKTF